MERRDAVLHWIVALALGWSAIRTVSLLRHDLAVGGEAYRQGDWLVSLAGGGLVRRGAFGSGLIELADALQCSPLVLLVGVQMAVVVALFALTIRGALRLPDPGVALLLFAGPGVFPAFWLNDPAGAVRKEAFLLLSLAMLLAASQSGKSGARWLAAGAVGFYGLGCLSHEALGLYLPAVLVGLVVLRRAGMLGARMVRTLGAASALAAAATVGFALLFATSGDPSAQCVALTSRGLDRNICQGAILWTRPDDSWMAYNYAYFFTPTRFLHLAAACVAALAPLLYAHHLYGMQRRLALLLALLVLPLAPLLTVAVDWGRFLSAAFSAHAFLLACLISTGALELRRRPALAALGACLVLAATVSLDHTIGWRLPFTHD